MCFTLSFLFPFHLQKAIGKWNKLRILNIPQGSLRILKSYLNRNKNWFEPLSYLHHRSVGGGRDLSPWKSYPRSGSPSFGTGSGWDLVNLCFHSAGRALSFYLVYSLQEPRCAIILPFLPEMCRPVQLLPCRQRPPLHAWPSARRGAVVRLQSCLFVTSLSPSSPFCVPFRLFIPSISHAIDKLS